MQRQGWELPSFELRASSFELRASSFELRASGDFFEE